MHIVFLGVGEACDERLANTSILVTYQDHDRGQGNILLDCGFTVPPRFFMYFSDPDALDAVWISHFHGDHFMGVPLLLLRLWEMKRSKPLYFVGQEGLQGKVEAAMDLSYPKFREKMTYPLEYQIVRSEKTIDLVGLRWSFAATDHWQYNLALCLQGNEQSVYYSGDGGPRPSCEDLAYKCSLIVQEGFLIDQSILGHGDLNRCLELTAKAQADQLAIVHVQRDVRRQEELTIRNRLAQVNDFNAFLPEPGDELEI